ncbi:hypothetical protein AB870_02000 [Pandoraea faecigallinarum]|uniref:Tetratrico peptide repeat group 5 domain-containing protein n=2 Tax=Pandoraea faecigallinarum TaxID=656179 RepID=A0A0H3WRJ2_9BURK|nr:hypothetical protein AB870_02000 [Pandoraea faecigallinarum]
MRQDDIHPGAFARPGSRQAPSNSHFPAIDGPIDPHALAHAHALHAANDLEGAAQAFAAICRALPADATAYKAFGYVLCQLGDYRNAIAPLMVAVTREYGNPEPLYFAALCMQQIGDVRTAREMAVDALEMVRCSDRRSSLDLDLSLTRLLDAL